MVSLHSVAISTLACGCLLMSPSYVSAQEIVRIPAEAESAQLQLLREIPISTEVTGTLITVDPTQEGTLVKKGDLLISVNDAVIRAEVAHATTQAEQTTEIMFAEKSKASAAQRLKTMEEANERTPGAFNQNEMRQAKLEVDKADAQLAKSMDDKILYGLTADIKRATLAQYEVKAPFDGMVTKVHRYAGTNVRPGDPILTITDMSELRASLEVNFVHRDLLFVGDSVEIRIDTSARSGVARPAPFSKDADTNAVDIFKNSVSNSSPLQAPPVGDVAATDDPEGQVFIGEIRFVEPTVRTVSRESYVKLSVLVPNHQDKHGRYLLQQGMPIKAVVLARKRDE